MPIYTHNPGIEIEDVARFMAGSEQGKLSKVVRNKVIAYRDELISSLNPQLTYNTYKIFSHQGSVVRLDNGLVFTSPKLARTLRPCRELVCFLATAGAELDREISRLTGLGRISNAYVLDSMGSMLAESVVEDFQEKIRRELSAQAKGVTLRFSPGYCDWPIEQQRLLFGLVDAPALGVSLSPSCLMTPRKSIAGVFGIHLLEEVPVPYIPCRDCGREDCESRRAAPRNSTLNTPREVKAQGNLHHATS
jgi:hypothetical protein